MSKEMTDVDSWKDACLRSIVRTGDHVFCSVPRSTVYFVRSLEPVPFPQRKRLWRDLSVSVYEVPNGTPRPVACAREYRLEKALKTRLLLPPVLTLNLR